jgi:hypothetical protein
MNIIIEGYLRLMTSLLIQFLIFSVVNQLYQAAYIYALTIIIVLLFSSICSHNSSYYTALLTNQLKGAIIFLIY